MIYQANKVKNSKHADSLGKHLLRGDDNEIVKVLEIRGTARPDDLTASLRSMQRATALTRGQTGLFNVAINPRKHEADSMTPAQWERSIQALEDEFKELAGQPRAVVEHRKNNRSHLHVVYQLTNTETGKLIDLKFDQRRCQDIGRRLEREFGHEVTTQQPSRNAYNRKEQQQAKRLGQDIPERRNILRKDFALSADWKDFQNLLATKGYTLAKGDRAGAVLIDSKGEIFGFGREIGLKAAEVKKYIGADIDKLPTIEQAKKLLAVQKEKQLDMESKVMAEQENKDHRVKASVSYSSLSSFKVNYLYISNHKAPNTSDLWKDNMKLQEREKQTERERQKQEFREQMAKQKKSRKKKGYYR